MTRNKDGVSRRNVLKATSGAAVGLAVTGLANAKPDDLVRVNIGYSGKGGRKAALNAASAVRRDFSFDALSLEVPEQAISAFERRPDVRYVEEDGQMHALADSVPWGVDRVDAEQAHADGYTGAGADIAILDTGIDSNHSDLDNVGYSRGFGYSTWEDGNGHGTHCAGITAAGNSGPCSYCVGYPAAYSSVMAVSSTNSSDGLSYSSSTGPEIEIAAPGSNIYSTSVGGTYTRLSGTSMACPHVSGAAGQLMANGSTNSEARSQLKSTAEDIGLSSNESGSGLLDVAAALGYDSSDST